MEGTSSKRPLTGQKILIVEDEEILAWSIGFELEFMQAKVNIVHSLGEAKITFEKFKPDIVICDASLPDGHCFKIVKDWQKTANDLKTVLMSANKFGFTDESKEITYSKFLQKPFKMSDLLSSVEKCCCTV